MTPTPIPTLVTPRLVLRPLRHTDAPQIQRLFPHWEMLEFMAAAIPWPYPEDGARQHLETLLPRMEQGREYDWAITLKAENTGQLIGVISLYPESEEDNRGFWLAQPYQNQGLMKEATFAVNDFAFFQLGMTQLTLNNAEPNHASHRLKEVSGARIIEITEDVPYVGGRFRQIRWLLTRDDWEAHRHLFANGTP